MTARLVAYTRALGDVLPQDFLRHFAGEVRVFWQRGQYSSAYAGAGAAVTIRASGARRFDDARAEVTRVMATLAIDTNAPSEVRPRFFGGFAFEDAAKLDALWQPFGSALLILPRYLLTRVGGYSWLTICDYDETDPKERLSAFEAEFRQIAERLRQPCQPPALPKAFDARELVGIDEWREMMRQGVGMIRSGALRKIVLARALEATFDAQLDPVAALGALERNSPTAFRFLFEPEPGAVFFGATPELLVRLEGGGLATHALAGSAPRGVTPDEDDRLASDLLTSAKDRHEHALVVDWLRATLTPLSRTLEAPEQPVVTKLKHIQHLFTPVQAQLRDRAHLLQVIERLHPTPALGGDPQGESRDAIGGIERLPRGWYGAPVGWLDAQGEGEFAVAIRSAVGQGAQVRLYAGAGIVADSDADREWAETGIKFKPLMGALDIQCEVRSAGCDKAEEIVMADTLERVTS
jgi:menaquinone-specific isochorismate synthase